MLLDLNDPLSIVRWWEVYPERHGPLLQDLAQRLPQFRSGIQQAQRLIADTPRLHAALDRARRAEQALEQLAASRPACEDQDDDEGLVPALSGRDEFPNDRPAAAPVTQDLAPQPAYWH
jgi:hypothetical protein